MDLLNLKTLINVSITGNISKSASKLCVTQSAVSRRIKALEDHCGKQLLDRSGSTLTLTDAGKLVVEKAQQMMSLEKEMLNDLKDVDSSDSFSFACTPAFAIAHLPNVMKDFMLHSAHVSGLEFMFDIPETIVQGIKNDAYDMAIIEHCQCLDLSEFITEELPGDDIVFISSPKLGLPMGKISIDELTNLTLYGRQEGCCSRIFLDKNLSFIGRNFSEFKRFIVYDDIHLIINAVINGDGIAFISSDVIAEQLRSGQLQQNTVQGFQHARQRTLVQTNPNSSKETLLMFRQGILAYFDSLNTGSSS